MSTKILIENNKIVFEGHAEDSETCRTLTAICDALAVSEDFETVKYENGYAEFNRVSGGDAMMFEALQTQLNELSAYVKTIKSCKCDLEKALADYLTKDEASKTYEMIEAHLASIQLLQDAIDIINNTFGNVDTTKGTVAEQLNNMNVLVLQVQNAANEALNLIREVNSKISALENKATKTLPYTADELIDKLSTI